MNLSAVGPESGLLRVAYTLADDADRMRNRFNQDAGSRWFSETPESPDQTTATAKSNLAGSGA